MGELTIRFLVEGEQSGGSVAVFEAGVPAGARVPVAHSREVAAVLDAAAGVPPDLAAVAAVMRRHGLTPVP